MHRVLRLTTAIALAAALTAGMIATAGPAAATGGAFISNGTVMLGVHNEGHLNVGGGPRSLGGTTTVGLRFVPTGAESTAPGCLCEGWGAADAISRVTGFANQSVDGGARNLDLVSFSATPSTAVSIVRIDNTLEVTHDYHPSVTPNLYEVSVIIKNISESVVSPLYRRVMDWDIEPTPFNEFVTIIPGNPTALLFDSNDGFQSANPLAPRNDLGFTGEFIDAGPDDHGAMFDFGFPNLAPGAMQTFKTFYGAAANEVDAIRAIVDVRAETFSLGQASTPNGPSLGTPNTFIFAFAGIGGRVFCAGAPSAGPIGVPPSVKKVADKAFCDTLAALQLNVPLPELPRIPGPSSGGTLGTRRVTTPHPMNRGGSGVSTSSVTPPSGESGIPAVTGSRGTGGVRPVRAVAPTRAKSAATVGRPSVRPSAKRPSAVRSSVIRPAARPRALRVQDLGKGWLASMAGLAPPRR